MTKRQTIAEYSVGQRLRRRVSRWGAPIAVGAVFVTLGVVAFWPLGGTLQAWLAMLTPAPGPAPAPLPASSVSEAPTSPALPALKPSTGGTGSSVSPTPIGLVLTGTQVGSTPADSLAFLGTDPENPQTYGTGSRLANGARIVAILNDRVVLERGTERAELLVGGAARQAGGAVRSPGLLSVGGPAPPAALSPARDRVGEWLRIAPQFAHGQLQGFVAAPGSTAAAFHAWGLKDGDLITSIDGALPQDAEQATFLLHTIVDGGSATVTVLRQGDLKTLTLDAGRVPAPRSDALAPPT